VCDISASANGNCNQSVDWNTVAVESAEHVAYYTSIAVHANGDPMISYSDGANTALKFAICDLSESANGNCDQSVDWTTVAVESAGQVGQFTSITLGDNGDPMISYYDITNEDLKFAICDLSESANGNCDQSVDWTTVAVDSAGAVGEYTSIAVDANGNLTISYYDITNEDLRFAICDLSESANGNCDQSVDWTTTVTVDSAGAVGEYTSIAVDTNGDPMISYYDATNEDLRFAICDLSESANGNCDQSVDWTTTVTVDSAGRVGYYTSIAVDANGNPMISYLDGTNGDLKFATARGDVEDVCPSDPDNDADNDLICLGDGYLPPMTGDNDNCPDDYNPAQENGDGDGWGDACDNCPTTATPWYVPEGDEDCDGFTSAKEAHVGTDPLDACPDNPSHDAWPVDTDVNTKINVLDLFAFTLADVMGTSPGEPNYNARFDLTANESVDVLDLFEYVRLEVLGTQCTNP
jgi:hypothetical protein